MVASGDRFDEPQPQPEPPVETPQFHAPRPQKPRCLADELRRRRLERGWSLRRAANELRISSSSLLDYEKGRRIPAEDLISVFERALELPADTLQRLRREALIERAQAKTTQANTAQVNTTKPPADDPAAVGDETDPAACPPERQPPESQPPETTPHGRARLVNRLSWRRLAEAVLCALLGSAVTLAAQALSHTRDGLGAAPPTSHSAAPIRQVTDDQDPHETACDRDGTTIGAADVVVAQPYRLVVAQVVVRYSPSCAAVWVRFEPTRALDRLAPNARVTLLAQRPADQRRVTFTGEYIGVSLWSNMLLTRPGCVIGTVQLSDPAVPAGTAASTPCVSGPSPATSRPNR